MRKSLFLLSYLLVLTASSPEPAFAENSSYTGKVKSIAVGMHDSGDPVIKVKLQTPTSQIELVIPTRSNRYASCASDKLSLLTHAFQHARKVTLSSGYYGANSCEDIEVRVE